MNSISQMSRNFLRSFEQQVLVALTSLDGSVHHKAGIFSVEGGEVFVIIDRHNGSTFEFSSADTMVDYIRKYMCKSPFLWVEGEVYWMEGRKDIIINECDRIIDGAEVEHLIFFMVSEGEI